MSRKDIRTNMVVPEIDAVELVDEFDASCSSCLTSLLDIRDVPTLSSEVIIRKGKNQATINNVSLSNAVRGGYALKLLLTRIDELYQSHKEYLIAMAQGHQEGSKTVTFVVDKTKEAVIEFEREYTVPDQSIPELKKLLGPEKFNEIFKPTLKISQSKLSKAVGLMPSLEEKLKTKIKTPALSWKNMAE